MTSTLQANIKKQLFAQNMTAAELERHTGIPHAVINILHGRSKNPSIHTAQAIAKELGCSVEELLSDNVDNSNHSLKTNSNLNWDADLYAHAFQAVFERIKELKLKPDAQQLSACITEVYLYAIGGATKTIDQRFVTWIISKTFINNKTPS